MRVGPPELSGGKIFWPVQVAIHDGNNYNKFLRWDTVQFYETKEDATKAAGKE
jgi:hypothetical protein